MRILVTNDDGIDAPGLVIMESIARDLAGPHGQVLTVAPDSQKSGVGHAITYGDHMQIIRMGTRRFKIVGTPADCVIAGIHHVMRRRPDVVLSGVNKGNNSGENAIYSGTVGAAMEGALQGVKSIAYSQYFGILNRYADDPFEAAREHGLILLKQLLHCTPWDEQDYRIFVNVNFPPCCAREVAGTSVVRQGFRRNLPYSVRTVESGSARHTLSAKHRLLSIFAGSQTTAASPNSDVNANMANRISITPMRADLTAHEVLPDMSMKFQGQERN